VTEESFDGQHPLPTPSPQYSPPQQHQFVPQSPPDDQYHRGSIPPPPQHPSPQQFATQLQQLQQQQQQQQQPSPQLAPQQPQQPQQQLTPSQQLHQFQAHRGSIPPPPSSQPPINSNSTSPFPSNNPASIVVSVTKPHQRFTQPFITYQVNSFDPQGSHSTSSPQTTPQQPKTSLDTSSNTNSIDIQGVGSVYPVAGPVVVVESILGGLETGAVVGKG
jgi:hypothetical protein